VTTAYLYVKANALYGTLISPSQHGVFVSAYRGDQHRGGTYSTKVCWGQYPAPMPTGWLSAS
jgi:hypothetical protein